MNKVVHFEVPAKDMGRARKFYEDIFGWKFNEWQKDYFLATTVASDEAGNPTEKGAINGAISKSDPHNQATTIVIQVDNIDEYLTKIDAAGGALVMPKQKMGEMGFYAKVIDSEENVIGLWESLKK